MTPLDKRPLKVLLWSPQGAGLHYAGAGINAFRMYERAADRQLDLTLVHGSPQQEIFPLFRKQVYLGPLQPQNPLRQLVFLWKAWRWLRRNGDQFDIFHGLTSFETTIRPATWAERFGLPAIVKPANQQTGLVPVSGLRGMLRLPERRRQHLTTLSGVVAISDAIHADLLSYGIPPERIFKIPNGVDTDRFKPTDPDEKARQRRSLDWGEDALVLLFVGEIAERKQPSWLIEALPGIKRAIPSIHAAFVGPEREPGLISRLAARARALGVEQCVSFAGFTRDVGKFYAAADALCLPSRNEGMPNAVLEAMASGLPCLVTRISGSEELIVEDRNGYFVGGPGELAQKAIKLFADRAARLRMGEEARNASRAYSTERILDRHVSMFRTTISRRTNSQFVRTPFLQSIPHERAGRQSI